MGLGWDSRGWGNTVVHLNSQGTVRQGFLKEGTSDLKHGRGNLAKKVEEKHYEQQEEQF